jgi:hypothetical protein
LTVDFAVEQFTITVDPYSGGTVTPGSQVVDWGATPTYTIVADSANGYELVDVKVDGTSVRDYMVGNDYTFDQVYGDHTLTVDFAVEQFTITVFGSDGGTVSYENVIIPNGDAVTVNWGAQPTFTFNPETGYHVAAVIIDDVQFTTLVPTSFTASYTFNDGVTNDHTMEVRFAEDGEVLVPAGEEVTVFLSPDASLTFDGVSISDYAYGAVINWPDEVVVWNITVLATFSIEGENGEEEGALVALRYDPADLPPGFDPTELKLYTCIDDDFDVFLKCDFTDNGLIDGQDVKVISNLVKHPKFTEGWTPEQISQYDITGPDGEPDGILDEYDIHAVNDFNGMSYLDFTWIDITDHVDTDNFIIYGFTTHFSIFRCR